MNLILSSLIVGQCLMLATILGSDKEKSDTNQWLFLALFGVASNGLEDIYSVLNPESVSLTIRGFSAVSLMLIGPALYAYLCVVTNQSHSHHRFWMGFLMPFVIFAASIYHTVNNDFYLKTLFENIVFLVFLQINFYAFKIFISIKKLKKNISKEYSNLQNKDMRWLTIVVRYVCVLNWLWIALFVFHIELMTFILNCTLIVFLRHIGFYSVTQKYIFEKESLYLTELENKKPIKSAVYKKTFNSQAYETVKYSKSLLTEARVSLLKENLMKIMINDKPFLDSHLTLAQLARMVNASAHELSQCLSIHLNTNFYDYINQHRVEAVKLELMRQRSANRGMLEIALECGFGSKSAFNDAFKASTTMTPSAYRKLKPIEL
jgi:AraC-like DNA-binding protein